MNTLLNLVGLSIGLALYGMLLWMVIGGRGPRTGVDPVALATAMLGVVWNVCALCMYGYPAFASPWVTVCGFSALGFLPAVVVHSVVRDEGRRRSRLGAILRTTAYGASSIAAVLHVEAAVASHNIPSVFGLRLLTVCFIVLLLPLARVTVAQPGARRALWVVALAAFAVSALHLSEYEQAASAWPIEVIGHHASIPLAVAILYQDYPFAFADLFLKRAFTLIGLVALASIAFHTVGLWFVPTTPAQQAALVLALCVGTALAYRWVIAGAGWFVDSVLLTRPDYRAIEGQLARRLHLCGDVLDLMDDVCRQIATALSAKTVRWYTIDDESQIDVSTLVTVDAGRSAEVLIPVTEHPRYTIEISDLTHGRRLLSDDVSMLIAVAGMAARRIDGLRLASERVARETHDRETAQLLAEAELRALRAQLNPHFLFNALTTIGHLIRSAPEQAVDTLLRLTTLLRAVLKSGTEFNTLGSELELIEAYLAIESARFEDRLRVHLDVPPDCRAVSLPALLIQPLVENAIKHGIATSVAGGHVVIAARIAGESADRHLRITVTDLPTIPTLNRPARRPWTRGVGLASVEQRLACHYGSQATLRIDGDSPAATVVEVMVPLAPPSDALADRSAG